MNSQGKLEALLGSARLELYLDKADGNVERAADLYRWATELSGVLHGQLSYVEIAVRNALDRQLQEWNEVRGFGRDWTAEDQTADPLYELMGRELRAARKHAALAAAEREADHHRHGAAVNHDDILTQLTFGKWVHLIYNPRGEHASRVTLWAEATHRAFERSAHADAYTLDSERARLLIGRQLHDLRRLRNRVAHHENLLSVNVKGRLDLILSMLARIDPNYLGYVARQNPIRTIIKQDPRRQW